MNNVLMDECGSECAGTIINRLAEIIHRESHSSLGIVLLARLRGYESIFLILRTYLYVYVYVYDVYISFVEAEVGGSKNCESDVELMNARLAGIKYFRPIDPYTSTYHCILLRSLEDKADSVPK